MQMDRTAQPPAFGDQGAQAIAADPATAELGQQRDVDQHESIDIDEDQFPPDRLPLQFEQGIAGPREMVRIVVLPEVELHAAERLALVDRETSAFELIRTRAGVQPGEKFEVVRARRAHAIVGQYGQVGWTRLATIGVMLSAQMLEFRRLVFSRSELREALQGPMTDAEFVAATVALAAGFGVTLAADEVRQALDAGQREWIERWL